MKYLRLLILSLFISSTAFSGGGSGSGNEQGNGGFVLDCKQSIQGFCANTTFYDVYESQNRYSLMPFFDHEIDWKRCGGADGLYKNENCLNYSIEVAMYLLNRLKNQDEGLFNLLQDHVLKFAKESKFLSNIVIFPTEDMGIGFVPPDKELKQLVVQHEPIVDEDPRYIVSRDLWVKMNPDQQAAGILHEVIYRQALIRQELKSSQMVRYFNALILSGKIAEISADKYKDIKNKTFCTDKIKCYRD